MTERRAYKLLRKSGEFEIREYLPTILASIEVKSDFESSGKIGFRPLVSYISQNKIAMTAPVIQESSSEGRWIVSFVMPQTMNIENLPSSSTLELKELPAQLAAIVHFSGVTTWNKVTSEYEKLKNFMFQEKLTPIGNFQVARFDPPWKPGFMRYNEIVQVISS